jgi:hypothetical protein
MPSFEGVHAAQHHLGSAAYWLFRLIAPAAPTRHKREMETALNVVGPMNSTPTRIAIALLYEHASQCEATDNEELTLP